MKAAVYTRYGPPDVLEIKDVEKPVPTNNEVLIRIHATTVCTADWRMRKADPFLVRFMIGLWRPKKLHILGMEFAGIVESVGKAVTRFGAGDQVFGATAFKFGGLPGQCTAVRGSICAANTTAFSELRDPGQDLGAPRRRPATASAPG